MSLLQRRKTRVYIIYVPSNGQIDVFNSPTFLKIRALANNPQLTPIHSSINYVALDQALNNGSTLEEIFSHVHGHSIQTVDEMWVAGSGSSAFARECVRSAFTELLIKVASLTPESCLGRYVEMWRLWRAREAYRTSEKRGFRLPG
jgi:hypothetical protein